MLIFGTTAMVFLIIVGDRVGLHADVVPALLGLSLFGLRDHMQRRLMALDHFGIRDGMHQRLLCAQMTDSVSGLPSLAGLAFMPKKERCIAAALKVERFANHVAALDPQGQRAFVRAVASRINIIFPDQTVHQGEDGLFVWLLAPGDTFDPLSIIAQLTALFRIKVPAGKQQHDIGIAVGFGSDIDEPFTARLAVAIDRARISLFGTLTSVG